MERGSLVASLGTPVLYLIDNVGLGSGAGLGPEIAGFVVSFVQARAVVGFGIGQRPYYQEVIMIR